MRLLRRLIALFLFLLPFSATSLPGSCISYAGFDPQRKEIVQLADAIYQKFQVPWTYAQKIVEVVYDKTKHSTSVTPLDVLAIISVESAFKESAIHRVGPSVGLMQINAAHHKVKDLFKPEVNISTGIAILEDYHKDHLGLDYTLVAYNAGPARAIKICKEASLRSPCKTDYTKKVKLAKEWLKNAKNGKDLKT